MTLLLLLACGAPDEKPSDVLDGPDDTDTAAPVDDGDGDGYATADDCDDDDATVHPDAEEACDDLDADCDGVDCDATDREIARLRGERDDDQLGYGLAFASSADGPVLAAGAPAREADGDGVVYLWAGPFDGAVGAAQADAIAGGDGSDAGMGLCAVPDVDDDGDDELLVLGAEQAWVFPVGGGGLDGARASLTVRGDAGWACAGSADATGDGVPDFAVSLWYKVGVFDGAAEGDLVDADAVATFEDAWVVSAVGDTDGDGLGDFLVGASMSGEGAWLYRGPVSGSLERQESDAALLESLDSVPGWQVGPAGDVTGDGRPDLFVSGYSVGWILPGGLDGRLGVGDALLTLDFAADGPRALGDLDGDGASDLVYTGGLDGDAGGVGVLWGPLAGAQVALTEGANWWPGEGEDDHLGYWLAVGDVDGDDVQEVAVGATGRADSAGAVYLLSF